MKKWILLFHLLIATPLSAQFLWRGYSPSGGEVYTYRYTEYLSGKRREGEFTIILHSAGKDIDIEIKGIYAGKSGSLRKKFTSFLDLAGFIALKMYTYHWMIPLGKTVFMRGIVGAFEGKTALFKEDERVRVKGCSAGGLKGKMIIIEDGEVGKIWICASGDLSLPLIVRRRTIWDDLYEAVLLRQRNIK